MSWGVCGGRDIETYTVSPTNSPLLHHPAFSVSNPPPPHHNPKPFHTTTSKPPFSTSHPPYLIPKPVPKKKSYATRSQRRTYSEPAGLILLYRRFECIPPAVLKIYRSKSNDQKTVSQPIKTEALTICR